jgi:hypothetical protein
LYFVQVLYRDKKVVGVFVRFRALHSWVSGLSYLCSSIEKRCLSNLELEMRFGGQE